jgi:hypothetical protein
MGREIYDIINVDVFLTAKHLEGCLIKQYAIIGVILKRCWIQ